MGRKEGVVTMLGCWVSSFSKSIQLPVVMAQGWELHHGSIKSRQDVSAVHFHTVSLKAKDDHRGQQRKEHGGGKKKPQFHEDLLPRASIRRT